MIGTMLHTIPVYKYEGETPLACIKRIQQSFPYYEDLPMTYAGRLDPMADGLLILLAGEECKNKESYLDLDKTYIVDIAFGINTDTHDALGSVTASQETAIKPDVLTYAVKNFIGKQDQLYPDYSSKTVHGKPLFYYARNGLLDTIERPSHTVNIYTINIINKNTLPFTLLQNNAIKRIGSIEGDFRQQEILQSWQTVNLENVLLVRIEVQASRGTYMRQLACDIGKNIGCPAIAWRIYRSKIGNFELTMPYRREI